MPTPYERLRSLVNAALPERTELAIGAQFWTKFDGLWTMLGRTQFGIFACRGESATCVCDNEVTEILGPEVSLADVLRAIEKGHHNTTFFKSRVLSNGELWTGETLVCTLDLSLPVSRWPDETLNQIIGLIG